MKRIILCVIFVGVLALLWWACRRAPALYTSKPKVVVSGYVPYTLANQIAGDRAEILMLLPPGAEPHSFEPTPGALVALNRADAFVYVSNELEPWAADLAKAAGPQTRVLELGKLIEPGDDPHLWMDFNKATVLVRQITGLLETLDPQNKFLYQQNYTQFTKELADLQRQFQAGLAVCKTREVVHIGHLAFGSLLAPYGIKLTALSGTSHEGEHSAKKIIQLVRKIKNKQIPAIFTEETLSPRLARAVAGETGAEILPLYPIEHISRQDFEKQATYAQLMKRNLASLQRGLQCQVL